MKREGKVLVRRGVGQERYIGRGAHRRLKSPGKVKKRDEGNSRVPSKQSGVGLLWRLSRSDDGVDREPAATVLPGEKRLQPRQSMKGASASGLGEKDSEI